MKSIFSQCRIRLKLIMSFATLVMPCILTAGFLGIMYSMAPGKICSSFLLSAFFLYFVCLFISMTLQARENDVFEEVLLLHSRRAADYYLTRELMMMGITLVFTIILTLYPIFVSITWPTFFTRAMEPADVAFGGMMILVHGICGMAVGDLFHPRIFGSRRTSIVLAVLLSLLAVCKIGLIQTLPRLGMLEILVPPLMDGFRLLGNGDAFDGGGIFLILLHFLLYSIVLVLIKIRLLTGRKFRN
ncbi:MAG: hypothetical protein K6E50_06375 [Lachnospiraceae bacterium]|nr:hypothetical protein [Lachnospiraceae bacterium]